MPFSSLTLGSAVASAVSAAAADSVAEGSIAVAFAEKLRMH